MSQAAPAGGPELANCLCVLPEDVKHLKQYELEVL